LSRLSEPESHPCSSKCFNIIIRTKHGQTAIVMQYGHLQNSLTCVTTSCSNDSFASPTQRTNQLLDKVLWNFVPQVRDAPTVVSFSLCKKYWASNPSIVSFVD
jgi:hypothetical protein